MSTLDRGQAILWDYDSLARRVHVTGSTSGLYRIDR